MTELDERFRPFMLNAIDEAARGRGHVEPNPRVGAVALREWQCIGTGHHARWGGPHAEVAALQDANERGVAPDTLIVTLEPCSSRGGDKKQPPCTDALIESGVETVVIGAPDPDPRHAGRGAEVLRDAGLRVLEGVEADRCRELLPAFERWLGLDRPWVIAKWAMTLDGKIAATTGDSKWISGEASRRRAHALRARVDAVLVGFRTVARDDPQLTVRDADGEHPIRVVVDPKCETALDRKLVTTAREVPTWILVADDTPAERRQALEQLDVTTIPVAANGPTRIDMSAALRELRSRGLRVVLAEGGGSLLAQLFENRCVDQVAAFLANQILLGGAGAPTPFDGQGFESVREALRLDERWFEFEGEDLFLGGLFH